MVRAFGWDVRGRGTDALRAADSRPVSLAPPPPHGLVGILHIASERGHVADGGGLAAGRAEPTHGAEGGRGSRHLGPGQSPVRSRTPSKSGATNSRRPASCAPAKRRSARPSGRRGKQEHRARPARAPPWWLSPRCRGTCRGPRRRPQYRSRNAIMLGRPIEVQPFGRDREPGEQVANEVSGRGFSQHRVLEQQPRARTLRPRFRDQASITSGVILYSGARQPKVRRRSPGRRRRDPRGPDSRPRR